MSTPQTDAHNEYQKQIYTNFQQLVDDFQNGIAEYDFVEEELDALREDDDVDAYTFRKCEEFWADARNEEDFWQEEERLKWKQLEEDSGI